MIAEGDDGPFIPSMAAEAIVRHCLAGRSPAIGARPAATELELADYDRLFARRNIKTGFRETPPAGGAAVSAAAGRGLGLAARAAADPARPARRNDRRRRRGRRTRQGLARAPCRSGHGLSARRQRMFRSRCGFVSTTDASTGSATFAGRSFSSIQEEGQGRFAGLLCERFGPLNAGMALVIEDGRMRLDRPALELPRHSDAARTRAARRLLRIRAGRPLPVPRGDRASVSPDDRPLSRLARPAH